MRKLLLVVLFAPVLLAGCGGGDEHRTVVINPQPAPTVSTGTCADQRLAEARRAGKGAPDGAPQQILALGPGPIDNRGRGTRMRIAFLADIHANLEALHACLGDARTRGAERFVFLGDYVGYGPDPEAVVEAVMTCVAQGAMAVRGNHDHAVGDMREAMALDAQTTIAWTRGRLGAAARAFLADLPLTLTDDDRLYVHADASAPARWHYVLDDDAARRALAATGARLTLCGHVHVPMLYAINAAAKLTRFRPPADMPVPLSRQRRWLAVLGSVGQPRDGSPASCYAMLETATFELVVRRVPYDHAATAAKMRAAGLPEALAARLAAGR
jgi:diadenosine tetraphosphatase ApaH/serine/threonine PP2A family protein phosphatase